MILFLVQLASSNSFHFHNGTAENRYVYEMPDKIFVHQSLFYDFINSDSPGGAILVKEINIYLTISESFFVNCSAQNSYAGEGGAIYAKCIDFIIMRSIGANCMAAKGYQFIYAETNKIFVCDSCNIVSCGYIEYGYSSKTFGVVRGERVSISVINFTKNQVYGFGSGISIINNAEKSIDSDLIDPSSFIFTNCIFQKNSGQSLFLFSGYTNIKNVVSNVNIVSNMFTHGTTIGIIRFNCEWIFSNCIFVGQNKKTKLCSIGNPYQINFLTLQSCQYDGSWKKRTQRYFMKDCKRISSPTLKDFPYFSMTIPIIPTIEISNITLTINVTNSSALNEDLESEDVNATYEPTPKLMKIVDPFRMKEFEMIVPNDQKPMDLQVMYPQFCCSCKFTKKINSKTHQTKNKRTRPDMEYGKKRYKHVKRKR
ncbi:hypothetical protein TRFO_05196 [Tritrichomonas foetus]|uniref:Uncharacterized protein n=1 Tax=Tritrichomonas foetus TaxID=1144522 RepID=A0A1J4K9H6_9EUKA|nr:hypothetical protein TRFO_05196 [Tritrichomonas foetus]|eukprot:OHT07560.1 hypothetical protein TRFO_05196 [Tritrichomonas foetus]